MKNVFEKFLATFLAVTIMLCSAPLSGLVGLELPQWLDFSIKSNATVTGPVISGECGENLTWSYDNDLRIIKISGTGDMYDYTGSDSPFYTYRSKVYRIDIDEGVTSIGDYAFSSLSINVRLQFPKA